MIVGISLGLAVVGAIQLVKPYTGAAPCHRPNCVVGSAKYPDSNAKSDLAKASSDAKSDLAKGSDGAKSDLGKGGADAKSDLGKDGGGDAKTDLGVRF